MDDNVTAQADFLGNLAVGLVVVWIAGAAFFALAHWRGEGIPQGGAAMVQAGAPAELPAQ